jgi:uncharacterized integral membrane protein
VRLSGYQGFHLLFLVAFAIKNTDPVSVRSSSMTAWQAPLIIVVLAFFAGGALLGAISLLGSTLSPSVRRYLAARSAMRAKAEVRVP